MITLQHELPGEIGAPPELRIACFSEDEKYRYSLTIVWNRLKHLLVVIGLNPSTADHRKNDNTMSRVTGFALAWGYGGIKMLNAFALRSRDPKALFKAANPVGDENTIEFLQSQSSGLTLAAWGATIQSRMWAHQYRGHEIAAAMPDLHCFRRTASGHPEHPLYLPADIRPVPFEYPR